MGANESVQHNNRGVEMLKEGRLEQAVVEFDQAIRYNNRDPTSYRNRGFARLDLGDAQGALQDLLLAAKFGCKDEDVALEMERARSAVKQQKLAQAAKSSHLSAGPAKSAQLTAIAPSSQLSAAEASAKRSEPSEPVAEAPEQNSERASEQVSRAAQEQTLRLSDQDVEPKPKDGDPGETPHDSFRAQPDDSPRQSWSRLELRNREASSVQLSRAEALLGGGSAAEASRLLDDLLPTMHPGDRHKALRLRGLARFELQELGGAVVDLSAALRVEEEPLALNCRGTARLLLKDYEGAAEDFETALKLEPEEAALHHNLANVKLQLGRWESAVASCSRALLLKRNARVLNTRGEAHLHLGDAPAALVDFSSALELKPASATLLTNRGLAKLQNNDAEGALQDAEAALQLDPRRAESIALRGQARFKLGDHMHSCVDFETALALNPDLPDALFGRGQARLPADVRSGLADLVQALARKPDHRQALELLQAAKRGRLEHAAAAVSLKAAQPEVAASATSQVTSLDQAEQAEFL